MVLRGHGSSIAKRVPEKLWRERSRVSRECCCGAWQLFLWRSCNFQRWTHEEWSDKDWKLPIAQAMVWRTCRKKSHLDDRITLMKGWRQAPAQSGRRDSELCSIWCLDSDYSKKGRIKIPKKWNCSFFDLSCCGPVVLRNDVVQVEEAMESLEWVHSGWRDGIKLMLLSS